MTVVADLLHGDGRPLDLDGGPLRDWLAERYALAGERWLRLNLVSTPGGQITGSTGLSEDLTGGIDRTLLGVLRAGADAVLIGAATLRAERYAPLRRARLVVATRGALVAADLPEPAAGPRPLVLCPAETVDRLDRGIGDLADVVAADTAEFSDALAAEGLPRVVCEGGGVLASALLAANAVDEFDQTIAPILLAPGDALLSGTVPQRTARLDGLLRDGTDRLYVRWGLRDRRDG